MHEVRIHLNLDDGVRWWAEDDIGFTGGSDHLEELVGMITEWADCEGVLSGLTVRFDSDALVAMGGDVDLEAEVFFGCEADTLRIFVEDLSTESAFADEEWEMISNPDRVLDPSHEPSEYPGSES